MIKTIRIAALAALCAFAVPAVASAAPGKPLPAEASRGQGLKKGHDKQGHRKGKRGERPSFPMQADKFMARVNQRIERIEARVDKRLERSKMSEEKKNEIRAKVAAGTSKVRAAAEKAAADGTVTKDEAKAVHQVAREMRQHAKGERKAWKKKHGNKGKRGDEGRGRRGRRGPAGGPNAG